MERRQFLKFIGGSTVAATGLAGCLSLGSGGGEYPSEPLNFVIPYGPGSGLDGTARALQPVLSDEAGVPVNVENISGAASLRGIGEMFNRPAEGYDFVSTYTPSAPGAYLTNPQNWNLTELTGITSWGNYTISLFASPDAGFESFQDMVERYNSGEFSRVGGLGIGHPWHMALVIARDAANWNWESYVNLSSTNDVLRALTAGEIPVGVAAHGSAAPNVEAGEVDILASLVSDGSQWSPNAPTWVNDLGYEDIDFISKYTYILLGPPEMESKRRNELADIFGSAVESDEFQQWSDENNEAHAIEWDGTKVEEEVQKVLDEVPKQVDIEALRNA